MIHDMKVVVVMPGYNAARTVKRTYDEIPKEYVDEILLVDDASVDDTLEIARSLGIRTLYHEKNRGYGANQKTCYKAALEMDADIIVMLHPDFQYSPKLLPAMVTMLAYGPYDYVLGSRILGSEALCGGMPMYKYIGNRVLTTFQNQLWGTKISEYHTGLRAFKRCILENVRFELNSDGFLFDNQMVAQVLIHGYHIGEVSCPTFYFDEASSINFGKAVTYGLGIVRTTFELMLARKNIRAPEYLKSPPIRKNISQEKQDLVYVNEPALSSQEDN
jgi:glycosyltransferase involved in cell wall biosynthesis